MPFTLKERVVVVGLLAGLILPMFLFGSLFRFPISANNKTSNTTIPVSAPPEPFLLNSSATGTSLSSQMIVGIASVFPTLMGLAIPNLKAESKTATPVESKTEVVEETKAEPQLAPLMPAGTVDFDFDGDDHADIGRWHASNTEFKVRKSTDGTYLTQTIGATGSKPAPGDFDGDGTYDAVVFNAGSWAGKESDSGNAISISWGLSGDMPVAGNYDGDTKTDEAVFRPSNSTWYVRLSSGGTITQTWGISGDIPTPGDFDGDGKTDMAVFRPSNGNWWITKSNGGTVNREWGLNGDVPVPADYTGDGKTDIAVYRPSNGTWYVATSDTGFNDTWSQTWGNYGDQPVPANYDGDQYVDIAIWRPSTGVWHIAKSSTSSLETHVLGVSGDFAVPSAYLKQSAFNIPPEQLGAARLSPRNATGGTDLYSQNFSWGRNLVSLPGRAGFDLNLGIGYNSLVWTKVGTTMVFDADAGSPTPGFRFGFPTIEPIFNQQLDATNTAYKYLMVTPSGARVEFRQTTVAGVYDAADGSYAQLQTTSPSNPNELVENLDITVTTTDGTKMSYDWITGAFRCTKITDRNGNYISATYDSYGNLTSVTDTLGRVVNVNYSNPYVPDSITQTWKNTNGSGSTTTHTWATFSYATKSINTNFGGDVTAVAGPADGWGLTVLDKITYADGSSSKFEYNDYAQVKKVSTIAADSTSHVLNYTETDLATPETTPTDCPRFTEIRNAAENFNSAQPVVFKTERSSVTNHSVGGQTFSGTKVRSWVVGHPNNLRTNNYFGASGWNEGLPLATEDCIAADGTCTDLKRWSWSGWTHDFPSETDYETNPRVTETLVGDGTNTKKTSVAYDLVSGTNIALYGLPSEVITYKADLNYPMKRVEFDYNLGSTYTSRRIIGLQSEVRTYGWNDATSSEQYTSRTSYLYDEGDFSDTTLSQTISPTRHDSTNFGSSFIAGRGNLTSVTRWDVDASGSIASSMKYNTAGSVVSQTTPWDGTNTRTVKIGYGDSFNSTGNPTTYAYPTTTTDPAGNAFTVTYRYDIGANVEASSPAPANQSVGKITKRFYDSVGRLEKNAIFAGTTQHAYTRYEYPTNGIQQKVYSTIVDQNSNDQADSADEVLTETFTDGAGRVRLARKPHTWSGGSVATWAGTSTEYDILGRVKRQSVPTEVDSSWNAAGDDATRGFLWTHQKYDWMGRVVRKINTDGTDSETLNDSDILISYEGCGCAGGIETTVEAERVPIPGTSNYARRKQKSYADILGRTFKSETFEWDGTTVYSTAVNSFNGRDQVLRTRQYAGDASSSTYQDTTASYDGFGRLHQSHKPEQRDNSNNLKYTTYGYNPDGSVLNTTDGRGVITNYTYNSRGLKTNISWNVGSTGITDPADVSFGYDNAGNRTSMTDGLGTVAYSYNSLSQMISETRDFADNLTDAPNGVFALTYSYQLGGQLRSYTDPYGEEIVYDSDLTGRLSEVTGTSFGGVSTYASDASYRAWGGLKALNYGNGTETALTFNNRLQASSFELKKSTTVLMKKSYEYYESGQIKFVDDGVSSLHDNSFEYDHLGRLSSSRSSVEASGGTQSNLQFLPFRQNFERNAFGQVTEIDWTRWTDQSVESQTFVNNRKYINPNLPPHPYDDDGRDLAPGIFNGAGQMVLTSGDSIVTRAYDGNGREAKRTLQPWNYETEQYDATIQSYFIHSSVLGGALISEAGATGKKEQTYVVAGGTIVARQKITVVGGTPQEQVAWEHRDPGDTAVKFTNAAGGQSSGLDLYSDHYDPMGRKVGFPSLLHPPDINRRMISPFNDMPLELGNGCQVMVDGIEQRCDTITRDNVQLQVRYGNKVFNVDPNHDLPGSDLRFTFTWETTRATAGWTTFEDQDGNESIEWSDYAGSETSLHFTTFDLIPFQTSTVETELRKIIGIAKKAVAEGEKNASGFSCADVFGGNGMKYLEAYEKSIRDQGALTFSKKDSQGQKYKSNVWGSTSQDPSKDKSEGGLKLPRITVNTGGDFFTSATFQFKSERFKGAFGHLDFYQFSAAMLLHEIGHAVKIKEKSSLIEDDDRSDEVNLQNTLFIVQNCFRKPPARSSTSN